MILSAEMTANQEAKAAESEEEYTVEEAMADLCQEHGVCYTNSQDFLTALTSGQLNQYMDQ